tara:strand:+ start:1402 stop:1743 length:342 start_codon:yes stop_codon:yes gene_type:complete
MTSDLFNETKYHVLTWENVYKNTFTENHHLTRRGNIWISNRRSDMYVPCVSCYFHINEGRPAPSKVGGRVCLFSVFKEFKLQGRNYNHICKKCLETETTEFLETAFNWYQGKK